MTGLDELTPSELKVVQIKRRETEPFAPADGLRRTCWNNASCRGVATFRASLRFRIPTKDDPDPKWKSRTMLLCPECNGVFLGEASSALAGGPHA